MTSSSAFDVFISYRRNEMDRPYVQQLYRVLTACDLRVWFDEEQAQPGQPWVRLLEAGIASSRSGLVVVGRDGMGQWESEEVDYLLRAAVRSGMPVIPVLLPRVPADVVLPPFLGGRTWVDLRRGYTSELLAQLLWGITGKKPAPRPLPAAAAPTSLTGYIARRGHCIHKLKAKDTTGRWAYYFVLIEPDLEVAFLNAIEGEGTIDLEHYGHVIASSYGETPSQEVRDFLKQTYDFDV